jgi:hypothetical protein
LTFAVAGGLVLSVMLENLTLFPVAAMVNYLAVVIAGGLGLVTMGARVLMAHKELGTMRQRER